MSEEEPKIVAYPTKINPPHFGLLLELAALSNQYDKIYIVYCGGNGIVSTTKWINMVDAVLGKLAPGKYGYVISSTDFSRIKQIPVELVTAGVEKLITSSNVVFMNCAINGINAARMTKAPCYYDSFQQTAYGKGFILDSLKKKFKNR